MQTTDPRIEEVLAELKEIDRAVTEDDHAAFAARLADDLVVNNPQNTISAQGATRQANVAGFISYSKFERTIEYAGIRGDFVLLMGEERCVPKGEKHPLKGRNVRRRFTDLWKKEDGRWQLTARQASIVQA